jgi:hypothetical protein
MFNKMFFEYASFTSYLLGNNIFNLNQVAEFLRNWTLFKNCFVGIINVNVLKHRFLIKYIMRATEDVFKFSLFNKSYSQASLRAQPLMPLDYAQSNS